MRDVLFYVGMVALAGALISGLLGFLVYPAQTRRRAGALQKKKLPPPPRQGLARAMFIIFASAAFVCLFFGTFIR